MKQITTLLISFLIYVQVFADIAPHPIIVKGIYTTDSCKIKMTSEYVYADLFNDSSRVVCTFELLNLGDDISIQVGFPEMHFQYWSINSYNKDDKDKFQIFVDGKLLSKNDIGVPEELDSLYERFMYIYSVEDEYKRKKDSIYRANNVIINKKGVKYPSSEARQATREAIDSLYEWRRTKPYIDSQLWEELYKQKMKGNFPWYVWNVSFKKGERKIIKVVYSLPSGAGYGANYRFFKYVLETGSGWYDVIDSAYIKLKLHDIDLETIEEITPGEYNINKENKTIEWKMKNLEPTENDNIYVQYFNPVERKNWKKYQRKRRMARMLNSLNPLNWFR